ncbi:hypothetical protein LCGC14_0207930 [marine sediment metagenome]|uniref:Uncharacterized protein n=1 Tax=marine sediment metagenome TaxID=412755 RepID=A0A0F9UXT0_9ZZZZ
MNCDVKRCRRFFYLEYAAFKKRTRCVSVCDFHWQKHCDEDDKFDLRDHFYPKKV